MYNNYYIKESEDNSTISRYFLDNENAKDFY